MNSNNTTQFLVGKKGIPYPCDSLLKGDLYAELEAHIDNLVESARYAVLDSIEHHI